MSDRSDKAEKQTNKTNRMRSVYASLIVVGVMLVGFSAFRLIESHLEYTAARNEYQQLREIFTTIPAWELLSQEVNVSASPEDESESELGSFEEQYELEPEEFVDPMEILREINPDFIGWIRIDGVIDYPVVRGENNTRYLNTTFMGERNPSGAIFMDYRNNADFSDEVTIIYGHNMRDGSMFAPLHELRGTAFLDESKYIGIVTSDGELLIYRIFAARSVNAWDTENDPTQKTAETVAGEIREIPEDAEQILILSTCTPTADRNERLRIYAVREG